MAALSNFRVEGHATNRPPLFSGTNYAYWKKRMEYYLKSIDKALWNITITPYEIPEKDPSEWNINEMSEDSINDRAINTFYSALDENEFNRISSYTTAYQIWNTFEIDFEVTSSVKQSRLNMAMHKY